MKKFIILGIVASFFAACGGSETNPKQTSENGAKSEPAQEQTVAEYDPHRGEGKFENIDLGSLDAAKATKGKEIYEMKCQSCHKLTDERLVGPGWAGVSKRHTPAWLLNFITNPDAMIDKDPKLQAQLEICMVRMPNQNVSDDNAYELVEFMRQNDGIK